MTPDLRLAPAAVGAWFGCALGLVAAVRLPVGGAAGAALLLAAAVLAVGGAVLGWRGGMPARAVGVALAALGLGVLVAVVRVVPLVPAEVRAMAARADVAGIEAVVAADPVPVSDGVRGVRRVSGRYRVRVVVTRITRPDVDLRLSAPAELWCHDVASAWLPGSEIALRAVLHEGDLLRGSALRLTCRGQVAARPPPPWQSAAGALREGLVHAGEGWPADGAALLPGLVLGDTRATPADLREAMRAAGLTHLVAVSGSNVAVVVVAALMLAAALRLGRRARAVVAGAAIVGFVLLVRAEPSVVRAAAMGGVLVVAMLAGGRRRGPAALAAAVLVLVLSDPWLSVSMGFALSVAATAGLLALAPRWQAWSRERWPRVPGPVADALAVTGAAQLATAPLLATFGNGVGLVALPANLLAAPAVAPATVLGVVATLVSPVSPAAAHLVAAPAVLAAAWVAQVARVGASLPWGSVPWPAGAAGALGLVAVLVAVRLAPAGSRVLVAAGVAAAAVVVPRVGEAPWPPAGWVAVACSVGQGDLVVLADGDGAAVVVDAGPDPREADRCLRDLGVSTVTAVVLTHFHADHVEGLPGVLARRSVAVVLVSPLPEPAEEAARVAGWAAESGVPVQTSTAGEVREGAGVRWRVLWPRRVIRHQGSDPNNASLVLVAELGGLRLLLGADIEPAAQEAVMAAEPQLGADVVKVPHHGSRKQAPGFAAWSGARLALVSVGADNDYGHPAPATLAAYAAAGIAAHRTDTEGDLAVVAGGTGVVVVARGVAR